jgi:hypothetical protein
MERDFLDHLSRYSRSLLLGQQGIRIPRHRNEVDRGGYESTSLLRIQMHRKNRHGYIDPPDNVNPEQLPRFSKDNGGKKK